MTLYGLGWKKMTNTSLLSAIPATLGINLRMGGQYISYDSAYFAASYPSMFFWTNLFSTGFFNVGFYQNGIDLVLPPTQSWMTLMFKDSAVYTGGSLEIYTRWDTPVALSALSGNTLWAVEPNAGPQVYNMNILSSSLSSPQFSGVTGGNRPSLIIYHSDAPAACSGTPLGGGITGPADFCPGKNFTLFLSGASGGPGIAYQWQSAPLGNPVFTDIPGATLNNLITSMVQPTTYRCKVTCTNTNQFAYSGTFNVVFSALAQIDSVQQFMSGNGYTFLPFVQNSYAWLYQWHYGDGDSSTNVVGVHNYQNEGVYPSGL